MDDPSLEDTRWLTQEDQRLWDSFVELSGHIRMAVDRQLARDGGLSRAEYQVLVLISRSHPETARHRDLVNQLGWQRSRLSHLLARMISRGLVERLVPNTGVRGATARRMEVRLTPAGHQAFAEAAPGHLETVRSVLIDLPTPQEREAVLSISHKVAPRVHELGLD